MANRDRQLIAEQFRDEDIDELPIASSQIDAERDRRRSIYTFGGKVYQTAEGQNEMKITAAGAMAKFALLQGAQAGNLRWASPITDFGWIALDNTITPMDAPTMSAFADGVAAWVSAHIFAARLLKNQDPIPQDFATNNEYWPVNP
jgi:hypothetical protein